MPEEESGAATAAAGLMRATLRAPSDDGGEPYVLLYDVSADDVFLYLYAPFLSSALTERFAAFPLLL